MVAKKVYKEVSIKNKSIDDYGLILERGIIEKCLVNTRILSRVCLDSGNPYIA